MSRSGRPAAPTSGMSRAMQRWPVGSAMRSIRVRSSLCSAAIRAAMGDELFRKTGASNLFMVFGEPNLDVKEQKDGKLVVTVKGVDVYDPTTGQIRSNTTDDIACWFIDTDYNGESFFVRHANFTGADEPYEKLKRALRTEIDEATWSALCSTKSYPFDPPKTSKIAVKAINHYGDKVMKVYTT